MDLSGYDYAFPAGIRSGYQEGIFDYLIVEDCRYREREFFLKYDQNVLKVLVFEEE